MLVCGVSVGCLVLGSVNHRPEASIELQGAKPEELYRGSKIRLVASLVDEDGDLEGLTSRWQVAFVGQGARLYLAPGGSLTSSSTVAGEGASLSMTLPRDDRLGGSYDVEVRLVVRDPQRAEAEVERTLKVRNRAPEATIRLTADDAAPLLLRETHRTASAAASVDGDDADNTTSDLRCGDGQVETRWEAVKPAKSAFDYWRVQPCNAANKEVLDKLHFRLAPGTEEQTVTLRLTIRDRFGAEDSTERSFQVGPSGTPCIAATRPAVGAPASGPTKVAMVVDATPERLWVDRVLVALPTVAGEVGLADVSYRWSVAEAAEGPYETIAGAAASSLALTALVPGQRRYLRVAVANSSAGLAAISCPAATAHCRAGQGLPAGCYQWTTWEVTGR